MKRLLALACLGIAPFAYAQSNFKAAMAKLDEASAGFKNAQADVTNDHYTASIHVHDSDHGAIFIERNGSTTRMGATIVEAGQTRPARIINYDGKILQMYTTGINQDDVLKAGDNQASIDAFLTLGFGATSHDLNAQWNVTDIGPETVNGVKAEKLNLVSRDPSVAKSITHVLLWLDLTRGVSVRQQFFQSNGDTRTADYSNIRINQKLKTDAFNIPKGAQKIAH